MVACFRTFVRSLLVTAALALAAPVADAGTRATESAKSVSTETKPQSADADDAPLDGVLIIAGIVAVVVFAAWVASRVGDNKPHVMG